MKKLGLLLLLMTSMLCFAQTVPQYTVNLSFLTGGPYAQSSALDVAFGYQFTANNQLQADFITMPGANYTGYFGGDSWNLTPLCPVLATTSLSCGKFMPFVTGEIGMGRIDATSVPSNLGLAALAEVGAGYDPSGTGKYNLLLKAGWGHFGPSLPVVGGPNQSGNGFFVYSGLNFGGGVSLAATDAKVARMREASEKKAAKHLRASCKHGDHAACNILTKN